MLSTGRLSAILWEIVWVSIVADGLNITNWILSIIGPNLTVVNVYYTDQ